MIDVRVRMIDMASQENHDEPEHDLLQEGAERISELEKSILELMAGWSVLEGCLPQDCPFCGVDYLEIKGDFWHTDDCVFGKMELLFKKQQGVGKKEVERIIDPTRCQADSDGDCNWSECPQAKDYQSYCPIAAENEKEEGYLGC